MDGRRFDSLTRALVGERSRRSVLRGIAAAVVTAVAGRAVLDEAEAASGPRSCRRTSQCPTGATCVNGQCRCPAGQAACGNLCQDIGNSTRNCGACGVRCPSQCGGAQYAEGVSCVAGVCTPADPHLTVCDGRCVDLRYDVNNCGECGEACRRNAVCQNGQCINCVGETMRVCGESGCVDTASDPGNCGGCGIVCGIGAYCAGGACFCADPAQTPCWNRGRDTVTAFCVDLQHDPGNCGRCGRPCGDGEVCLDGACCSADRACGSNCCRSGEVCLNGQCCNRRQVCGNQCCERGNQCCGDHCCASDATCCGAGCCPSHGVCCANNTCCPVHTVCCGQSCCTSGTTCLNDACCDNHSVCGDACCDADQTCTPEGCCPEDRVCHGACCPEGQTCIHGACCPADRVCGDVCCEEGGFCTDHGTCCPPDRACGDVCCEEGGFCTEALTCCPPDRACSEGCCPDGWLCCLDACVDPLSNDSHCGACMSICLLGSACVQGSCCPDESNCDYEYCCPDGGVCCGGGCCDAGTACVNGECISCGETFTVVIAGDSTGSAAIGVDDNLEIYVDDELQVQTSGGAYSKGPFQVVAANGSVIRVVGYDTVGYCASIGPLYAVLPCRGGEYYELDTAGLNLGCGRPGGDNGSFYDQSWTISF